MMRGATYVRKSIADFLQAEVPLAIDAARIEWGLEDWELPYPVRYDSYDPLTAQTFPVVGSLVTRTSKWVQNDWTDSAEEMYDARYNVQAFLWVRTPMKQDGTWADPAYDSALRLRDDMMGIVRGVLLRTPSLNSAGKGLRLNEGTLTEDYLDALKSSDQVSRWLAGGTLSFELDVAESAYLPAVGSADTIMVTTDTLPA